MAVIIKTFLFMCQMYAGKDMFCHGEVVACYNLRCRNKHCMMYGRIPCFSASELSVFSIKEPQTHLRSSWILLKNTFKVSALFTGVLNAGQ